ncbi:hypothetical protein PV721_38815, partial [Streptomyces sp. MB09-01]|nr:hypothetical protein [Streptomyces sp. MB09-01]
RDDRPPPPTPPAVNRTRTQRRERLRQHGQPSPWVRATATAKPLLPAAKASGTDDVIAGRLHEARMVGNDSLHDGLCYSLDELADVAELVTEVVYVPVAGHVELREALTVGLRRGGQPIQTMLITCSWQAGRLIQ